MATKKQIREAARDGKITDNERDLLIAAVDRASRTGSGISASEKAKIDQQLKAAETSAIAKGGVTAEQLLGTAAQRQQEFGITPGGGGQPAPRTEVSRRNNPDGSVTITYSDGTSETIGGNVGDPRVDAILAQEERERISAYAILEDTFRSYGLEELVPTIKDFLKRNLSSAEATLQLKETEIFKERFKGNQGRKALGLPEYDAGQYIQAEESYSNILRVNGLGGLATKDTFAKLIGGAVSPVEVQDRVNLVFNKIDTASEDVKNELTRYFSQYNITDPSYQRVQLAEALLTGEDTAKSLEMNVRKAQLRAGATAAGFNIEEQRIAALERMLSEAGVSNVYGAGQVGFEQLSQIAPQAKTLAERYQMEAASEEELQKEAFLGLRSERRRRLEEQEKATFKGSAGVSQVSLTQQPIAGQI